MKRGTVKTAGFLDFGRRPRIHEEVTLESFGLSIRPPFPYYTSQYSPPCYSTTLVLQWRIR